MIEIDGHTQLELADLIRINRLVRGTIEILSFSDWFVTLEQREAGALLYHLHEFADQAGCDETICAEALQASSIPPDHSLITQLFSFKSGCSEHLGMEYDWLSALTVSEQRYLLPFLVYLFGYAEGRVFERETEASCNHWWHRDLLDERVVHDILRDPKFYMTSMRHDRAVKARCM